MRHLPLVSILVPIYGVEKYIERCANSLFNQSYPNCEFIFVNDCTQDNSIAILRKTIEKCFYLRQKVRIIHHEFNRGLGAARLTGLVNSIGDLVTFVDADDWVEPDYVEELVAAMTQHDADLVISSMEGISQDKVILNAREHLKQRMCRRVSCRIWGNLMKRSLMVEHDIWPIEGIDHAEDYHVMCKYVSECKRIVAMRKLTYHYTIDNDSSYTQNYTVNSIKSTILSLNSTRQYLLTKDPSYVKTINLSALEYYKSAHIRHLTDNHEIDELYKKYLATLPLSFLERLTLYSIQNLPIFIAKLFTRLLYSQI